MFRTKRQATAEGMVSIQPAKHQHVILESIQLQADYKDSCKSNIPTLLIKPNNKMLSKNSVCWCKRKTFLVMHFFSFRRSVFFLLLDDCDLKLAVT